MKQTKHFKRTAFNLSAKSMVSTLLLLIAMLMPQGAWAENFISEIKIGANSNQNTAKGYLSDYSYEPIDKDLNYGNGDKSWYIYLGYKTDTDASKAITGIMIVSGKDYLGDEYLESGTKTLSYDGKTWYRSPAQSEADINNGAGGDYLTIFYTRDGNTVNGGKPLVSLSVAEETGLSGYTYAGLYKNGAFSANGSTNVGTKGAARYITYTTHTHAFANADYDTSNHKYWCASCGYVSSTSAHDWKNTGAKISDVTCETAEVYYQKCSVCGRTNDANHTYTTALALGHNYNANGVCTRDASHFQVPTLSSGYYQIANYGNLCWFRDKVNGGSYTINAKQTADVTIPDDVTWDGIGHKTNSSNGFKGTYDGNCHTISGLKISQQNTAFFNTTNKATIKNLGLLNVSVSSDQTAGLVRYTDNSTTISNCYVTGSAERPLCYSNYGKSTITNCFANVTNGLYLVAGNYGTITNCYTNLSKINYEGSGTANNCRTGVNAATFASGEITYLLNSGKTDGTQVWYQKLGNGGNALPTLVKNTSNTVYKLENLKCDGVTKNGSVSYGNSSSAPVDAHILTATPAKTETCTEAGNNAYWTCSTCKKVFSNSTATTETTVAAQTIAALGHSYGVGSWSWTDDGHSATCTRTCSRDANHKSSASVTLGNGITSAQQVAPNCTTKGTTRYTATATVEGTQYNDTKDVVDIAALSHDYSQVVDEDYLVSAATCGSDAIYHEKCSRCDTHGAEWSATGTATGNHSYTNNTLTASPIEDGLYAYACDNGCGTHNDAHVIKDFNGEGNHLELTKDGEGNYSTSEDIILADANGFVSPVDFSAPSVTYTRIGIKNQFGTLVLPFDVNGMGADYDLYKLDQVFDYELVLRKVDKGDNGGIVPAGTPVLIRLHDDLDGNYDLTLTAASNAVSCQLAEGSKADGYQLVGTYETTELSADDYFMSNNKFWSVGDMVYNGAIGVKTAPFRAYLRSTNPYFAKALSINIADEDVTAVETLNAITEGDAAYYDMNGRRINSLQKGVNIVKMSNGKTIKVNIK